MQAGLTTEVHGGVRDPEPDEEVTHALPGPRPEHVEPDAGESEGEQCVVEVADVEGQCRAVGDQAEDEQAQAADHDLARERARVVVRQPGRRRGPGSSSMLARLARRRTRVDPRNDPGCALDARGAGHGGPWTHDHPEPPPPHCRSHHIATRPRRIPVPVAGGAAFFAAGRCTPGERRRDKTEQLHSDLTPQVSRVGGERQNLGAGVFEMRGDLGSLSGEADDAGRDQPGRRLAALTGGPGSATGNLL